jgi:hypothetical protein
LQYAKGVTGERITEATIKAKILIDPEYIKVQNEFSMLTEKVSQLNGIVRGFEHKKDMLVQLSALQRRELIAGNYEDGGSPVDLKKAREHNQ